MNNHRMCKMVFETLSKSNIEKDSLGKGDRVAFEYYLGRYELHQLHFRAARDRLLWCFNDCHINAHQQRRYSTRFSSSTDICRLIFIYLVTASLPIGIFPSP